MTSELKGIFMPVSAPVGGPVDATLRTDPWARTIAPASAEQFARNRVELVASGMKDSAIRTNIPGSGELARQAAVLRGWLLNGPQALSAADIGVVRAALVMQITELIDPLETPTMRAERASYLRQLDGELLLLQTQRG
jgi:hypothetical protein